MANRVPLIVDTSTLFIKELPLGDGLDLTGCSLVGVTSFTRSAGHEFSGITTFSSAVVFNAGITANTAKISDLTDNRVVIAGTAGELEDSGNLTFDGSTLGLTGSQTISSNLTVTGNAVVNGNTDLGNATSDTITATGRFDSALVPSADDTYDLGASDREWKDLYVDGVANIDNITVGVLTHTGLTQHRVVLAGADGTISDSSGLSYNGSTLAVTGDITATGNLNYQTVTDIRSVGIITASKGIQIEADGLNVEAGISTFAKEVGIGSALSVTGVSTFTGISTFSNGAVVSGGTLTLPTVAGTNNSADQAVLFQTAAGVVDGGSGLTYNPANDTLTVNGADIQSQLFRGSGGSVTLANDNHSSTESVVVTNKVTLNHGGAAVLESDKHGIIVTGVTTSSGGVAIPDDKQLTLGTDSNLYIKHSNGHAKNFFVSSVGDCEFHMASSEKAMELRTNSSVDLYYDATKMFATSGVGATVYGTGVLNIPVGTTAQRPGVGDETEGDIRYNTTTKSFEGYGNGAWGGLGGGTEIDNVVVTTSATGIGTFVKTDYRSASVRVQITQGTDYQVGRYLMIHDGTTVTVVEEAAIATNSMLGTIDGVISGSNAVLRVTMGSASSATITTIIDKISV